MVATAKTITLKKADAGTKKGVFSANVVWELSANLDEGDIIGALPDRIAYLFQSQLPKEGSPYPGLPLSLVAASNARQATKRGCMISRLTTATKTARNRARRTKTPFKIARSSSLQRRCSQN